MLPRCWPPHGPPAKRPLEPLRTSATGSWPLRRTLLDFSDQVASCRNPDRAQVALEILSVSPEQLMFNPSGGVAKLRIDSWCPQEALTGSCRFPRASLWIA